MANEGKSNEEIYEMFKSLDKEITDLLVPLVEKLQEKGFDYLIVAGEKVTKDQLGKNLPHEGLSCICNESEVPVLPAALIGVSGSSNSHLRFINDLFTLVTRMAKKNQSSVDSPSKEKDIYN